ncbi:MAG TPA: hypothetical protein VGC30_08485 [Dokdonella sp.]
MRLYDAVQALRDRAGTLLDAQRPSSADLDEAERALDSALEILDRPTTRELAEGDAHLLRRRYDVMRDLAAVYAAQGRTAQALGALEAMQAGLGSADRRRAAEAGLREPARRAALPRDPRDARSDAAAPGRRRVRDAVPRIASTRPSASPDCRCLVRGTPRVRAFR